MNHRSMRHKTDGGSTVLEMAYFSLILSALLLGFINGSAAWRAQHVLKNAVREGARVASLTPDLQSNDPVVTDVVDDILQNAGFQPGTYAASVEFVEPLRTGNPVTVTVTHLFVPVAGAGANVPVVGNGVQLRASAVMRYSKFVQE